MKAKQASQINTWLTSDSQRGKIIFSQDHLTIDILPEALPWCGVAGHRDSRNERPLQRVFPAGGTTLAPDNTCYETCHRVGPYASNHPSNAAWSGQLSHSDKPSSVDGMSEIILGGVSDEAHGWMDETRGVKWRSDIVMIDGLI